MVSMNYIRIFLAVFLVGVVYAKADVYQTFFTEKQRNILSSSTKMASLNRHMAYAIKRMHLVPAEQKPMAGFYKSAFSDSENMQQFFMLSGFNPVNRQVILSVLDSAHQESDYASLFSTCLETLSAANVAFNLSIDPAIHLERNILVYIKVLNKDHFKQFVTALYAIEEGLSADEMIYLLYRYVTSVIFLNRLYENDLDYPKPSDGVRATKIDISRFHKQLQAKRTGVSAFGQFIDDTIGREVFFLGLGLTTTFAATLGCSKLYSVVSKKPFEFKAAATTAAVPMTVMVALFIAKRLYKKRHPKYGSG